MVEIEENSMYMKRINNEKLIKKILSEKFILTHYQQTSYYSCRWRMDIYRIRYWFIPQYAGFVYTSEDIYFTAIVIGGDPELFKESAEKLEANGIKVTIQKPIK